MAKSPDEPDSDAPPSPEAAARAGHAQAYVDAIDAERAAEKDAAAREVRRLDDAIPTTVDPRALADAYADRGSAHGTLGDSTQALRDYATALDLATDRTQVICIKLNTALELLSDGQRRVSFSWAIDAVNDDVGDADSWDVLGLIAGHCEFFAFAVHALRRALALAPDHGPATLRLGQYLRRTGQFREAAELLDRYVAAHPREPQGWLECGRAAEFVSHLPSSGTTDGGHRRRAIECYRRALAENPDVILRSVIERAIGDFEEAEASDAGE